MRWDWYQATVKREAPEDVLRHLCASLGAERRASKGQHGYPMGCELVDGQGIVLARANWGGRNVWLNVGASGPAAVELAAALRAMPADHGVTRMDACEDFDGPGTFDRLIRIALDFVGEYGLTVNQAGDWITGGQLGRTLYIGAPSSAVRVRIYEKGKQLRAIGAPGAEDVSLDLVRVEVQVRPERDARFEAARTAPSGAFGFSRWTQELHARLWGSDVPRVFMQQHRESDDDRAFRHMSRQYAATLTRLAAVEGGWAHLGARLQRAVMAAMEDDLDRSEGPEPRLPAPFDAAAAAAAALGGWPGRFDGQLV